MTGQQGIAFILMIMGGICALLAAESAHMRDRFSKHPKLMYRVFSVIGWGLLLTSVIMWWVWRPQ